MPPLSASFIIIVLDFIAFDSYLVRFAFNWVLALVLGKSSTVSMNLSRASFL